MKKLALSLLVSLLSFFVLPISAHAVYLESSENVVLPSAKTIEETTAVAGNSLKIESDINGDLFCAGQNVVISGTIAGDVICVAQTITIEGDVLGNVRSAAQSININGQVTRNVSVAAQSLTLSPESNIEGDIFVAGQKVDLAGNGGRDFLAAGEKIIITGSLFRNASVAAVNIDISDKAKIGGNLDYYVEEGSQMNVNSTRVKGETRRHDVVTNRKEIEAKATQTSAAFSVIGKVVSTASFIILSLIFVFLLPMFTQKVLDNSKKHFAKSVFVGLAVLLTAPIACLLVMFTVVGIPVAVLGFLIYAVMILSASTMASIFVGEFVLKFITKKKHHLVLSAITGCLLVAVVSSIPVIGWFVTMVLFFSGMGSIFLSFSVEKAA